MDATSDSRNIRQAQIFAYATRGQQETKSLSGLLPTLACPVESVRIVLAVESLFFSRTLDADLVRIHASLTPEIVPPGGNVKTGESFEIDESQE